ncbi:P-loop containing nucleoside triphosphate hydrolase protein [Daedalea quercina L-15889]|uniref:p-loop containing nucleoside triphosphate hydrolase protein n=1 Tax=Daedalea quercina L-15889 TaxID=1314783 RepID=A0A165QSK9_9APHY|nr:P-loop containing nucleoside triphosphate hydrolase protein [Daedalea quercina L-15889]
MVGMAILASISGRAGVVNEELLRRNPAMRAAEERIQQLEAQLERERQEHRDTAMLAGIRGTLGVTEARRRFGFVDGLTHCAVVGMAGSGKSSLINALRGLSNSDPRAAPVGTSETTRSVQRYEDPDLERPFVWYDIPGVGTLNQPEARYFLNHGLFVFELIIVLIDSRFTGSDIAILKCCRELNIPTYIVRSKALQHIRNVMADMGGAGSQGGEDERWEQACLGFICDTNRTVRVNLNAAGLDDQRVYVVDKENMLRLVKNQYRGVQLIHEQELLVDMLTELERRRSPNASSSQAPRRRAITGQA